MRSKAATRPSTRRAVRKRGMPVSARAKRMEQELLEFRLAMDSSPDLIYLIDPDTLQYLYVNETACRVSGFTKEEYLKLGPSYMSMCEPDELRRIYADAIANVDKGVATETRGLGKNGRHGWFDVHRRALRVAGKWVIVSVSRDVTQRKHAERAAMRQRRMYAALSATNEAIMRSTSPEELYQRVCDAAVRGGQFVMAAIMMPDAKTGWAKVITVTGANQEKLRAMRISIDAALPEGRGLVGTAFRTLEPCVSNDLFDDPRTEPWHHQSREMGVASAAALPLRKGDLAIGVLLLNSREKGAFDQDVVSLLDRIAENVAFALANLERLAERDRAEQALRASEEKYRAVLENMSEGYFEVDLAGNYTLSNDAMARMHGCTREEMQGVNYRSYTADPDTVRRVFAVYNEVYRTGKPMPLHAWDFIRKDGTVARWEQSVQLIVGADGKPTGFRGVTRDVTNRHAAEEALRSSEEKYRAILQNMYDGFWEIDLDGNFTFFNDAQCRLLGLSRAEMTGLNYREYYREEYLKRVYEIFNEIYQTGRPAQLSEWAYERKDGTVAILESSVQLMRDVRGKRIGFRGVTRDVTARREAEQRLRESEGRFRSLTDLSSDWFWEQDAEFRFTKFEGRETSSGKYDAVAGFVGRHAWELPGGVVELADWGRHRRDLEHHKPFRDFEYAYRDRRGNLRYVNINGAPVFDQDGKFLGYRGTSRDITLRKYEARLLALEHAIARALAGADTTNKILETVMRLVCESEQWESGGYWSVDDKARTLRLTMGWNGDATRTATREYYKDSLGTTLATDGPLGNVLKTGKPLWVDDVRKDASPQWQRHFPSADRHSSFTFPVMADGKIIGLLGFAGRVIAEPDERLLQTVGVIGNQVGQFLQRKQAERVLRDSEARFRALTELSSDWYWEQDVEFRFTRVESRRADRDLVRQHLLGKCGWETGYDIDVEGGWDAHRALYQAHQSYRDVVMHRTQPDGSMRYISVSAEPVFDVKGRFQGYRGVSREITEQKVAEARIQYLATHDGLTNLPNREMFGQLLNAAIASARRHCRNLAVLFIDLDRFKVINDTLGHDSGDQLLQEVGQRLRQTLRDSDVIARLGGDEFVVLVPEMGDPAQAAIVARKILAAVTRPMVLAGQECRVTASIGIALYPGDGDDEQGLMKNADIAMYHAKEEGKNNYQFHSREVKSQSLEHLAFETNLRRALEHEEFSLHYQAKLDLKTNVITGVEALLRWRNPELGDVSPAQFIPLAEEIGLIVPIVGSSRVDLQACKLEYSIVSPK